jgi:hypothetical protein
MRIPTNWSEVSLKKYIDIAEINAIDMDEIDKQIKILSILANVNENILLDLNLFNLKQAIKHCQFIYTPPVSIPIKQYIRIGKHKYSINTNIKEITGGEYIDLTSMVKNKENITVNLPNIIAIFLHPVNFWGLKIKDCYEKDIQTLASRSKTAKIIEENLMMDNVMMLSSFFLSSWKALTKATMEYSEIKLLKTKKMLTKEMKGDFKIFGAGV